MDDAPLVTVLTPSLNAGPYIRDAIESVLAQDYPRIEHIVVDGGSTDGTCEILAEYSKALRYDSFPDKGAAHAINKGFERSSGSIVGWLNADDIYLPGAVSSAVRHFQERPGVQVVYGRAFWVNAEGERIGEYPTRAFEPEVLARECFICQPASFIRSSAFRRAGMLNPDERYAFDYDLWIRMAPEFRFEHVLEHWACSRMHRSSLTFANRKGVLEANMRILEQHFGYVPFQWIYAFCCYLLDRRDQFFEPRRNSLVAYNLSLAYGLYRNRKRPARFLGEWLRAPLQVVARAVRPLSAARRG